jgi:hypothetical protein
VLGVSPLGFLEDLTQHLCGVVDHAGGDPLVLGDRHRGGRLARRWATHHVGGASGRRGQVVDRADFGKALAVALLAFGQAGLELGGRRRRLAGRRFAQRLRAHDDPLAVGGDDEHLVWLGRHRLAGRVEVLDVRGRPGGQRLDLAFAELAARGAADRLGRFFERSPRALDGGEAPEPVGVALVGQVELAVGGIQVGVTAAAVGEPGDGDVAEDRGQRTDVAGLDGAVTFAVGVVHLGPLLAHGAQVELALEHLAQQLPTSPVELVFELGVAEGGGLGALQPADELIEGGSRHSERVLRRAHRRLSVVVAEPWRRLRNRARPASAWASRSSLAAS